MTLIPVAKRCSTSSIAPHGRATFARPWRRPLHRRGRAGRPRNRRSVGHPGQLLRAPSLVSSCPIRVTHTACRASAPSPRALLYHALRVEIGDDAFFATLTAFTDQHAHGTATPEDLQAAAETAAGRELGEFFDAWISQREVPDYDTNP